MRKIAALSMVTAMAAALLSPTGFAANHREAPITAFDHKADITSVFAFRSYAPLDTSKVTLIMCVDPFLEPAGGPTWFPFDPDILYELKIDNNNDAVEDIVFQFRFQTEQRLPNFYPAYTGVGTSGVVAPGNSPPPVPPGTLILPPQVNSFLSIGLGQRQSYTVTMVRGGLATPLVDTLGSALYAVPANAGPRTMAYESLFSSAIYFLTSGVEAFAGTVDDPDYADLGALMDTLNSVNLVLTAAGDAVIANQSPDSLSGFAVNAIALQVPIAMLTRTGSIEPPTSTAATIGVWATTSRQRLTVRRAPLPSSGSGGFSQVQRMGNPYINMLLVGTGYKDRFSLEQPRNDAQFANFFLDPALARVYNAISGGAVAIPTPPRLDLLPLLTYAPPIAAAGTPAGPPADILRLNTGVPPTPNPTNRLGLVGGLALGSDPAGFPNGRRLIDDVTDITLRLVAGGVLAGPPFSSSPINRSLGDGVNVNDATFRATFPYLASAPSGRDRRHIDAGESGCFFAPGAVCFH